MPTLQATWQPLPLLLLLLQLGSRCCKHRWCCSAVASCQGPYGFDVAQCNFKMRLLQHCRKGVQQLLCDSCCNCSHACSAAAAAVVVHAKGALAGCCVLQGLLLLHVVVADALGYCVLQHLPQRRTDAALCSTSQSAAAAAAVDLAAVAR
jgi:hypothetical protein